VDIKNLYDVSKEELIQLVLELKNENERLNKENQELKSFFHKNAKRKQYIYIMYFKQEPRKVYIGKTQNYNIQINEHKIKLRQGTHSNQELQNLFDLYGEMNLVSKIIEEVYMTDEEILDYEEQVIEKYKEKHIMLNRIHNHTFQDSQSKLDVDDMEHFLKIYSDLKNKKITAIEAIKLSGCSIGSFYRRIKEIQSMNEKHEKTHESDKEEGDK
jgi:hypothetical protein